MDWLKDFLLTLGPLLLMLIFPVAIILLLRWLGAWMFRINDVIHLQKEILEELRKLNSKS